MAAGRIKSLLERLAGIGATPEDTSEQRLRAGALILASVGIAAISFFWIGIYLAYGYYAAATIPFAYQVVTLAGLFLLSRTKRFGIFRTTQLAMWLILPALLQVALGGFVASSGMMLWAVLMPLAAVALLGVRRATPWLIAFGVVLTALAVGNSRLVEHAADFSLPVQTLLIVSNIAGLTLGGFLLLGYFVEQSERARVQLAEEQERSELLLRNVLPTAIAERLKRHEGVISERFDEVTVLFADIVGFTQLCAGMPPDRLVHLLDRSSQRSTCSPRWRVSRRSRRSATRTWWSAAYPSDAPITPRRSPDWRSRCAMRSSGSPSARADGLCDPHRHPHRPGRRRRDRQAEVHLRPVGRHREHREPHGVARVGERDPADRTRGAQARARVRDEAARRDRREGEGPDGDLLLGQGANSALTAALHLVLQPIEAVSQPAPTSTIQSIASVSGRGVNV